MKKILSATIGLLAMQMLVAQAPNAINYQGVAREADGTSITNQITVRFSIRENTANGNVLYRESHQIVPNANGLFALQIGLGNASIGNFSAIDWSTGLKFLQVGIDPDGGANFSLSNVSQLVSVPYALNAASVDEAAASVVAYDNTASGLEATDAQSAIDELDAALDGGDLTDNQTSAEVSYDNTASGLIATDAQSAIDEIDATLDVGDLSDDQTSAEVSYDNSISGLAATDVQAAIDELDDVLDGSFMTSDNVTYNSGDLSSDDFVFGSSSLDDDHNPAHRNRFLFDKSKGAFRAGGTSDNLAFGGAWNDDNRGDYSIGLGYDNYAIGNNSIALGAETWAQGEGAISMGYQSAVLQSDHSIALGYGATVDGETSSGGRNISIGTNATIGAFGTTGSLEDNVAIGHEASAGGNGSVSIGTLSATMSNNSLALGLGTETNSFGAIAIGTYNETDPSNVNPTQWVATDPLLMVGNGSDPEMRSNALVIRKDGSAQFNGAITTNSLEIQGQYGLPTVDGQSDQALVTDGNGNVSWVDLGPFAGENTDSQTASQVPYDNSGTAIEASTVQAALTELDGELATNAWGLSGNAAGALATLGTTDESGISVVTNNNEVMRLDADGDVGMGITDPSHVLHIGGETAQTDAMPELATLWSTSFEAGSVATFSEGNTGEHNNIGFLATINDAGGYTNNFGLVGYASSVNAQGNRGVFGVGTGAAFTNYGVQGVSFGPAFANTGVEGLASGGVSYNRALFGQSNGDTGVNYGLYAEGIGGAEINYGIWATAFNAIGLNYAGWFDQGDVVISNGDVGIGVAEPQHKLHVAGETAGTLELDGLTALNGSTYEVGNLQIFSESNADNNDNVGSAFVINGSGRNYGVLGLATDNGAESNRGVFAVASGASSSNRGVIGSAYGTGTSEEGVGVSGYATESSSNIGVRGTAEGNGNSAISVGISGTAEGSNDNWGLTGFASGVSNSSNVGARGLAQNSQNGINIGVYGSGTGDGTESYGGSFFANGGSSLNHGIHSISTSDVGTNYGVFAEAYGSTTNMGIFARSSGTIGDWNYGGWFEANTTSNGTNYGVRAGASNSTFRNIGLEVAASGLASNGNLGAQFTANGSGQNNVGVSGGATGNGVDNFAFSGLASNGSNQSVVYDGNAVSEVGNNYGVRVFSFGATQGTNYGVYASAFNGATNYAGWFEGDVHITGTLTYPSDRRLKRGIGTLSGSLDNLMKFRGTSFLWKDREKDQRVQFGVIAQELEKIYPELVYDKNGKREVNYIGLIPVLIEAIKEQNQKITVLEGQLVEKEQSANGTMVSKDDFDAVKARLDKLERILGTQAEKGQ